ncbi:MAG TPA: (d)CMP kinase, partial [Sulfitobacter sp.]|nr:(d)CMP kinase [Sulfitobacter sp.]
VAQEASKVAVIPAVRAALVRFQRSFAARAGGAVLDGRDIGTVICPDAPVKLFITASPEVRAQRRFAELSGKGIAITYETVLEDVKQRDLRDMSRDQAPLKPADDAKQIDTTEMAIEDAVAAAVALVEAKLAERG